MNDWISVKDKLPYAEMMVKCLDRYGDTFRGFYCPRIHRHCWFTDKLKACKHTPTHWKPL